MAFKNSLEEKYELVADTIRAYPAQLRQAWDEISAMYLPADYKAVENIVFCGMGGSALGARLVQSFAFGKFRTPFEIVNGYKLPNYVSTKSLVIVSSYSGTTEETIESTYEADKRQAKIFGITTGGTLVNLLIKIKAIPYVFDPVYNPLGQPRMAIGYASGAVLALLTKLGVITVRDEEVAKAIKVMNETLTDYHENISFEKNLAKSYAQKLKGKVPILVASEHLLGTAHTIKNQFNESAKTFAALFDIPELNHHLMEGLKNPAKLHTFFTFVFINSKLYADRIQKRYSLTADVVEKNGVPYLVYTPSSAEKLSQIYETLTFGSFVVFFLTKLNKIDPMAIPWVDYFKEKLSQS